jgi:hypothetical protein
MPNRPRRLKEFPYKGFVTYFLTICTDKHVRAFEDLGFCPLGDRAAIETVCGSRL